MPKLSEFELACWQTGYNLLTEQPDQGDLVTSIKAAVSAGLVPDDLAAANQVGDGVVDLVMDIVQQRKPEPGAFKALVAMIERASAVAELPNGSPMPADPVAVAPKHVTRKRRARTPKPVIAPEPERVTPKRRARTH